MQIMDSTDKKMNRGEADDRLSILEDGSQFQVGHRIFNDVEDLKPNMPVQFSQDPFMGEEGAEIQYRSMKWW